MHATITKHCLHHKAYLGSFSNGIGHTHMGTSPPTKTNRTGTKLDSRAARRTVPDAHYRMGRVPGSITKSRLFASRSTGNFPTCGKDADATSRIMLDETTAAPLLREDWYKYVVP